MSILIGKILLLLLDVAFWIIIIQVVLSWLVAFDVVNVRNPQAANLVRLFERLTDPVYRPLRKYIPAIAGIDITPIIVILGIQILKYAVVALFFHV
jgi:YggT family protein